jgi:parallel beta-helix repeat protein
LGSSNNSITGHSITNTSVGIYLIWGSSSNIMSGNSITDNDYGISLWDSSNNRIYHNNFINNKKQVYDLSWDYEEFPDLFPPSINVWDDGYPSGGNYWSDYVGVDVKCGPAQDLPGSDGIGDAPYVIDANNRDRYPLMCPYGAPLPPMYSLTIITTVGGTTDPAPGTYSYTANSRVQVTAIPNAGYFFDYWELDGVNVGSANPYAVLMDMNHMLKAVFSPLPLTVSINPLSASILVGQSVTFTSTVLGGYPPYSYQWYLNNSVVSGAASNAWTFTPLTIGTYKVYLKVTDSSGNVAISDIATITVAPQLTISISPMSASILVGQSVTFTSTTSGGYPLYTYQWFLNGNPVSGATSNNWTFTPTTSGIFYIHLKVTDDKGNTAQSDAARIVVSTVPVGGYSIPPQLSTKTDTVIPYTLLVTVLTATFIAVKRKYKKLFIPQ